MLPISCLNGSNLGQAATGVPTAHSWRLKRVKGGAQLTSWVVHNIRVKGGDRMWIPGTPSKSDHHVL